MIRKRHHYILTPSNVNMGSATKIAISRASSSFTHTLTYKFGSSTGTIVSKTTSTSASWTPAISLANQMTLEELKLIADVMGVTFEQSFIFPDGEQIKTSNE